MAQERPQDDMSEVGNQPQRENTQALPVPQKAKPGSSIKLKERNKLLPLHPEFEVTQRFPMPEHHLVELGLQNQDRTMEPGKQQIHVGHNSAGAPVYAKLRASATKLDDPTVIFVDVSQPANNLRPDDVTFRREFACDERFIGKKSEYRACANLASRVNRAWRDYFVNILRTLSSANEGPNPTEQLHAAVTTSSSRNHSPAIKQEDEEEVKFANHFANGMAAEYNEPVAPSTSRKRKRAQMIDLTGSDESANSTDGQSKPRQGHPDLENRPKWLGDRSFTPTSERNTTTTGPFARSQGSSAVQTPTNFASPTGSFITPYPLPSNRRHQSPDSSQSHHNRTAELVAPSQEPPVAFIQSLWTNPQQRLTGPQTRPLALQQTPVTSSQPTLEEQTQMVPEDQDDAELLRDYQEFKKYKRMVARLAQESAQQTNSA